VAGRSPATEAEKRAAAWAAARLIRTGMTVGLGSGSTVAGLVEVLAQARPDAYFVAASPATAAAAKQHGLPLVALDAVAGLDLAIDGADQIAPSGWLIKGGGAAHTREKIVAAAARRFIVIASSNKLVERLRPPLPLELLPFAPGATMSAIGSTRRRANTAASPDGGVIADYHGSIDDPGQLARRLDQQPGVIAHGLFPPAMVDLVLVGRDSCRVEALRPSRSVA
jgi:ribose 5-phosphate isomerase A